MRDVTAADDDETRGTRAAGGEAGPTAEPDADAGAGAGADAEAAAGLTTAPAEEPGDTGHQSTVAGAGSRAASSTSPMLITGWKVIVSRTSAGTSSRSPRLRSGRMTSVMPAAWAASTFCLRPPIGSTRPCSVTSPVIPTVCFTGRPLSNEASAVTIVTPALGPSLGMAPAGTWTWNSCSSNASSAMPSSSAWPRT